MRKLIACLAIVMASSANALPSSDYMCQYVDSPNGREYYTSVIKYRNLQDGDSLVIIFNGYVMNRKDGTNGLKFDHDYMASFRSNIGVIKIPLNEDNCSILEYPEQTSER